VKVLERLMSESFGNGSINLFRGGHESSAKLQEFWELFLLRLLRSYVLLKPFSARMFQALAFPNGKNFYVAYIYGNVALL
jgi:hypothetical protein